MTLNKEKLPRWRALQTTLIYKLYILPLKDVYFSDAKIEYILISYKFFKINYIRLKEKY